MSKSASRSIWTPLLLFSLALVLPDPARACSVCLAGDPVFEATGTSVGEAGQWNLFIQGSGWKKTSGVLPGEDEGGGPASEKNQSQRLDVSLGWTPVDRFTLSLNVPFAFNHTIEIEGNQRQNFFLSGLSDVSLMGSAIVWRDRDVLPETWLEARVFVKAPTGKSRTSVDGVQDPHLQRGTGSWDGGFGLAAAHKLAFGSLYASASYRVNTEGSLAYEYGDNALANLALLVPVGHALGVPWLAPWSAGLELNYRWADTDQFHSERYHDSGGSILYSTPSLRVALTPLAIGERQPPSLRCSVQVPLTSAWLHGFQREDPLWRVGLAIPF